MHADMDATVNGLLQRSASMAATASLPRAPQSVDDTGLGMGFLVELVAKVMYQHGVTRLTDLATRLCLPAVVVDAVCNFMRREALLEVLRRGSHEADVNFELTDAGRTRAAEWLARNRYAGPAPVTLADYAELVRAQSTTQQRLSAHEVHAAFADLVIPTELLDQLGVAINSGKPMLLYGPSGSGKTYIAEQLRRLLGGPVAVPHAICVHGEVIRIYDCECHRAVAGGPVADAGERALDGRSRTDARWVLCERPVVLTGGELTIDMLDLHFDPRAGYYEAPPQFKANNGLFIVDDLGRQVVTPRDLMNRWIVPMERRHDFLTLHGGAKFTIPFDLVLVFSTNLLPSQLDDASFLRRLGHKVHVAGATPAQYQLILLRACRDEGLTPDADGSAWQALLDLHEAQGEPLLAGYPSGLTHLIASRAAYLGSPAELSAESIGWAWHTYFVTEQPDHAVSVPATAATPAAPAALHIEPRSKA